MFSRYLLWSIVDIDYNFYQGFKDPRVLKGPWELWELGEIQETKEQLDLLVHQGPQVLPLGHRRRHLRLMVHQLVQQVKLVRTFIIYHNHSKRSHVRFSCESIIWYF